MMEVYCDTCDFREEHVTYLKADAARNKHSKGGHTTWIRKLPA